MSIWKKISLYDLYWHRRDFGFAHPRGQPAIFSVHHHQGFFVPRCCGNNFFGILGAKYCLRGISSEMELATGIIDGFCSGGRIVILTSVVRTREAWLKLLDFSLGASLLLGFFGLGQVLKIENLLATSGTRVDATLGNPAFFAAYLLLQIGIAFILFTLRQSKIARGYYIAVILFYTFLIFTTQTRGAVMGLAAGLIVGAMLMAWVNRENVRVRRLSIGLLLAVLLALGSLYASRDTAFVKNSFLQRIANISPNNRTAQTRLVTWSAAWDGWKEKFVLGWGLENFDVVFNKNFPPSIYEDEGSVVWFDRAHNVILDRGVTTGILGLGLFLTFLIYPAYRLLRYFLRDPLSRNISIVAASLTVAYLVQ